MPTPTNTYTVTVADTHAHSVAQSGVPGNGKIDAALSVLQPGEDETNPSGPYAALLTADTWTITITQP
jgi:hypothetical protein